MTTSSGITGGSCRETHPDKLIARGVPAEFIAIATAKLAALNGAYDRIRQERAFA